MLAMVYASEKTSHPPMALKGPDMIADSGNIQGRRVSQDTDKVALKERDKRCSSSIPLFQS